MPVNILLADDHEVVRQGLRTILNVRPAWHICGEAENGQQAIDLAGQLKPDIVILDITMPVMSGLEAVQKINDLYPATRVLIFTMHESRSLVNAVRRAGAQGCVLKSRAARDLIRAIEALLEGGTFWGPGLESEPDDSQSKGRNLLLRHALKFAASTAFEETLCCLAQLARNNVLLEDSSRRVQATRFVSNWRIKSIDC
jgi:DNA-binding NarL/FixJ family response regulator